MPDEHPIAETEECLSALQDVAYRFPRIRPRVQFEVDQFGQRVDWTWYARAGHAYVYSDEFMAVTVEAPQIAATFRSEGRWEVLQEGDWETTFLVPDDDFPEVAQRVGLYERR